MPGEQSANGGTPAVELRNVRKNYGDFQAVKALDLTVPMGSTYALLGPNGAGKTTTIRMILRILDPDGGTVQILGEPLSQHGLDRVGYLPEERGVYKKMHVTDLLVFLGELKGMSGAESRPRIAHWLERLELASWAGAKVDELSKGMQQKLQFISAILHEPAIVILDEPFSGLDPINQQVLRQIISELKRDGRTILFSTHIIEHAERICDHVCIIARGEKVADGTMAEVKQRDAGEYVALRVGEWTDGLEQLLRGLRAVRHVRREGIDAELALAPGADAQEVLKELVQAGTTVRRFECTEPSLEQVFIDRVGAVDSEAIGREEASHV